MMDNVMSLQEELVNKIFILNSTAWENRVDRNKLDDWLSNFSTEKEKLHGLFLISQFMYFGSEQIRALLKSLFRDHYMYPKIEKIRIENSNTLDSHIINYKYLECLNKTRFLGLGNPSESGAYLLYFFRQENKLPTKLFVHSHKILNRNSTTGTIVLSDTNIDHYVFLDDFCGSGEQTVYYAQDIVNDIKHVNPNIIIEYLSIFTTTVGKQNINKRVRFDKVDSVFELDESFKCFSSVSRFFHNVDRVVEQNFLKDICKKYGKQLMTVIGGLQGIDKAKMDLYADRHALGFDDGQQLIGFHHNTPDNTLPIIWFDEREHIAWKPIFRRYNKVYG